MNKYIPFVSSIDEAKKVIVLQINNKIPAGRQLDSFFHCSEVPMKVIKKDTSQEFKNYSSSITKPIVIILF